MTLRLLLLAAAAVLASAPAFAQTRPAAAPLRRSPPVVAPALEAPVAASPAPVVVAAPAEPEAPPVPVVPLAPKLVLDLEKLRDAQIVLSATNEGLKLVQTNLPGALPKSWVESKVGQIVMGCIAGAIVVTSAAGAAAGLILTLRAP